MIASKSMECQICERPLEHADWRLLMRQEMLCSAVDNGTVRLTIDSWLCSPACAKAWCDKGISMS